MVGSSGNWLSPLRDVLSLSAVARLTSYRGSQPADEGSTRRSRAGRVTCGRDGWPLSVLTVGEQSLPQCHHYRVQQKLQVFRNLGVPVHEAPLSDLAEARNRLQLASLLIVYRLPLSPALQVLLDDAHSLEIPVVYEVDDLVYRRDALAENRNLATLPDDLRSAVIAGSDAYAASLLTADVNLAATSVLASDMHDLNGRAGFHVENGIDDGMLSLAGNLAERRESRDDQGIVVTYGSGSRAHDADFAIAARGLSDWLAENPSATLRLIGPVRVPDALAANLGQIHRIPGQLTYAEYLQHLRTSTITLAPLIDDTFNRCKSHVRYLESGLMGTPVIASPTVYGSYLVDGETGVLATEGEWYEALCLLAEDASLRARVARQAREHVRLWELSNKPSEQMRQMLSILAPGWSET